jgi:hypothetical protein
MRVAQKAFNDLDQCEGLDGTRAYQIFFLTASTGPDDTRQNGQASLQIRCGNNKELAYALAHITHRSATVHCKVDNRKRFYTACFSFSAQEGLETLYHVPGHMSAMDMKMFSVVNNLRKELGLKEDSVYCPE